MDDKTLTDAQRLRAIIIYCEGLKADFPHLATAADNIIELATKPAIDEDGTRH